jgi:AraC-like DNA-binding protein
METHAHFPAHSRVSPYIMMIWEVRNAEFVTETILPQGAIEMVFNLADGMCGTRTGTNKKIKPARCFVQGISTQTLTVSYRGKQNLFGIHLKPHMVKSLLNVLPSELKDEVVDLSLISSDLNNLWNQLAEAADFEARVRILEDRLPVLEEHNCPRTQRLSDLFLSGGVEAFRSMGTLADEVCYSSRHLNRKAQSMFGLTAEELIAYKKFLYAIGLMHGEDLTLTDLAYKSGFYDQAHFCRTFKSFTGLTPRQYKSKKSAVPFHLFS